MDLTPETSWRSGATLARVQRSIHSVCRSPARASSGRRSARAALAESTDAAMPIACAVGNGIAAISSADRREAATTCSSAASGKARRSVAAASDS